MNPTDLQQEYDAIRNEAARLAGGLTDLAQRATVYHHLFADSGGNHVFPLIAAHGALWARGYFRFGMRLGRCMALRYWFDGQRHRERLAALEDFADSFRDINRRVCVDIYTNYHFTKRFGDRAGAERLMPRAVFEALERVHWARREGRPLSDSERLSVFEAHFRNEQQTEVGPSVARASAAFEWPSMKWLALQPVVRFAYFPGWRFLQFRDFADVEERIRNGLQAFAWGAEVGWDAVDARLSAYRILPLEFFTEGPRYFGRMRKAVLLAT